MASKRPGPWAMELDDFARAFSGAFLFGIPLLYTMEMWWIGTFLDLWKLLIFLVLALLVNLNLAYYAGFKRESTFATVTNQAVDAVAVGVVGSLIVLLVLNRIGPADPLGSVLGKIVVQAVPLSIGASVANALLGGREGKGGEGEGGQPPAGHSWRAISNDVGATIAGAIFIGATIAPTDEVPMLAAAMGYTHLLALIALSLAVTYLIVFESGFSPQRKRRTLGFFHRPFNETILAYAVSLLVAFVALFLFDRIEGGEPVAHVVAQTLVLGLPASIGGAAGRLVV